MSNTKIELDKPRYAIVIHDGATIYEVDLETCTTSAEMLDWVMQLAKKNWLDDLNLGAVVRLMNAVLNPQASLCSGGSSKTMTNEQIRQRVDAFDIEGYRRRDRNTYWDSHRD